MARAKPKNPLLSAVSAEHYTPREVVAFARYVMGRIDLDPASTVYANHHVVEAARFFGKEEDGLVQPWRGRVLLNPPGDEEGDVVLAKPRKFWERGVGHWQHQDIECMFFVGFQLGQLSVFQQSPASPLQFVTNFVRERMRFLVRPFVLDQIGVDARGEPVMSRRTVAGPPIEGDAPMHANYLTFVPPKDPYVARPMMRRFVEGSTNTAMFGGKCAGQLVRPVVI